jgi:hypothetical protein
MGWWDSISKFGSGLLDKAKSGAKFLQKAGRVANRAMDFLGSDNAKKMSGVINKYVPGFSNFHNSVNKYGTIGADAIEGINKKVSRGMSDVNNLTSRYKNAEASVNDTQQQRKGRNRGTMERKKPVENNEYDTGNLFG